MSEDREPIHINLNQAPLSIALLHQLIACLSIGHEVVLSGAPWQDPASAVLEFMDRLTRRVHLHDEDKKWLQEAVRLEVRQALEEQVKRGRL